MVATSVSGAVQPALWSHAPNLSTTKAVKRAPTVAREAPPCGAPHGDRGNGLEFPVSVPLLDHEEFRGPILQAQDGFDTREAGAHGLRRVHSRCNLGDVRRCTQSVFNRERSASARHGAFSPQSGPKYPAYTKLRKTPSNCAAKTSGIPLDKAHQPIQVIFLSGSRNRSWCRQREGRLRAGAVSTFCWSDSREWV